VTQRCRCAERRQALRDAGAALLIGDRARAARDMTFVATSTLTDVASLATFILKRDSRRKAR